jgi:hypothetical protein
VTPTHHALGLFRPVSSKGLENVSRFPHLFAELVRPGFYEHDIRRYRPALSRLPQCDKTLEREAGDPPLPVADGVEPPDRVGGCRVTCLTGCAVFAVLARTIPT